jgi:hypothetical protein
VSSLSERLNEQRDHAHFAATVGYRSAAMSSRHSHPVLIV